MGPRSQAEILGDEFKINVTTEERRQEPSERVDELVRELGETLEDEFPELWS